MNHHYGMLPLFFYILFLPCFAMSFLAFVLLLFKRDYIGELDSSIKGNIAKVSKWFTYKYMHIYYFYAGTLASWMAYLSRCKL